MIVVLMESEEISFSDISFIFYIRVWDIRIFGLFDKEIKELRKKNKGMYCEMFKFFIF